MQDRYVADIGDFGKYALLKALAGPDLRLGIVWYLNPDEEGNTDGSLTHYPDLRGCDENLHDMLQVIARGDNRRVGVIEQAGILPANTAYYSRPLTFSDLPSLHLAARRRRRQSWLVGAVDAMIDTNLVFCDPDNGFPPPSISVTANASQKYVFPEELLPYLGRGQSLVIYHHHARHEPLVSQVQRGFHLLHSVGAQHVWALSFHRRSVRAYFVVATAQHIAMLRARSEQFLATSWGGHFKLHIPDSATTPRDIRSPLLLSDRIIPKSPKGRTDSRRTTDIGNVNRNGQTVVKKTGLRGTDFCQYVYVLECRHCSHRYGANGSDVFQRRCPHCQSGKPGLPY